MDQSMLDLYSDYLISSFSKTTATGLSNLLEGAISHDKVTRFLSRYDYGQKEYWKSIKKMVRQMESEEGIMSIDDTILEKPSTDENSIVAWHFDHSKGRNIKGVNILTLLYHSKEISLPAEYEIIHKDERFVDEEGKEKRKSRTSKNELFLEMIHRAIHLHCIPFWMVLGDIWFASTENMKSIKQKYQKEFCFAMKSNRTFAYTHEEKLQGEFHKISEAGLNPGVVTQVYLKGLDFPVSLVRQHFTNKDGSTGDLYLVCSDLGMDYEAITAIYHKRWKVEEYHKSIKQNTGLGESPTKRVTTQSNHFLASIYAFCKMEMLKCKTSLNHFALKNRLYLRAMKRCFEELQRVQQESGLVLNYNLRVGFA